MKKTALALTLLIAGSTVAAAPEQSWRQIIPAVASTDGADGSHWRSDLVIFNPSDRPAVLTLELLPSGFTGVGGEPPSVILAAPVAAGDTEVVTDVVATHFPGHTTGALVVLAHDGDGDSVPIAASSRTWTPAGATGSYGQGVPAVAWREDGALSVRERRVIGLESTDIVRTNLGIVNPTAAVEETFLVEILDAAGDVVGSKYYRLGPGAHLQRNDILTELGLAGEDFTAVVTLTRWQRVGGHTAVASAPDFVVYGSRIDRRSNDPTYLEAQSETTQSGLPRHRLIPAAARVAGAAGADWRSDVVVHAAGDTAALVVELIPRSLTGIGAGNPERMVTSIRRGQTRRLDDIIGEEFPDHDAAALVVRGLESGAGATDVRVVSRTWTPTADGSATMGQGIPGVPRRALAEPMVVPGLEESSAFRSNLGLVNPSRNIRATLRIDVRDPVSGAVSGVSITMEPWSQYQLDGILQDLGLTDGIYTAVVTMTAFENTMTAPSESWDPVFIAYGSKIDNATNDPTFIDGVRLTPAPPAGRGDWVDFTADEPWYRCPDDPPPDEAVVVRAFDRAEHWFGAENHRNIAREVDFPAAQAWNQVGLRLELECPENGLCDHWDRTGSLQLVLNPDDPEDEWRYLEIMRHITPYRVGMCEFVDITPLAPLLVGRKTLVSWIDTWVGPGHPDGEGWRITWDFVFYPGDDRTPDDVVNIWGRRSIEVGNLEPDRTVNAQTDPVEIFIPADADRVEARLTTTGHSFGNALNCAEFCAMRQDLLIDGERRSVLPWRTDCEHNPVANQQGTWQYDRNGWCPGAVVIGQTVDVTDMVVPGETAILDFDIRLADGSEYVNTNPGGGLTPIEWVSLQLYIYGD